MRAGTVQAAETWAVAGTAEPPFSLALLGQQGRWNDPPVSAGGGQADVLVIFWITGELARNDGGRKMEELMATGRKLTPCLLGLGGVGGFGAVAHDTVVRREVRDDPPQGAP